MVTVTGGKLTTYRRMAEDTVDAVVEEPRARQPRPASHRCRTKRLALHGAARSRPSCAPGRGGAVGLDDDVFAALWAATAARPRPCWSWPRAGPSCSSPWSPGLPHLRVEALWAARHEMAMTVDDVLSRRTRSVLRRAGPRPRRPRPWPTSWRPEWDATRPTRPGTRPPSPTGPADDLAPRPGSPAP